MVQNIGDASVFLGGETVAAAGEHLGYELPAGAKDTLPAIEPDASSLYGITAGDPVRVVFLYP